MGNKVLSDTIQSFKDLNKKQISKSNIILNYTLPIINGDIIKDITDSIKLDKSLFKILESSVNGNEISVKLKINTKKVISYIKEINLPCEQRN